MPKDAEGLSDKRAIIDFPVHSTYTVKFAGRWLDLSKLRGNNPDGAVGPRQQLVEPGGATTEAVLVANPYTNLTHVLAITCVAIPSLSQDAELFSFYGGFDPPEKMTDPTKPAGFLASLYPISDAEKTRDRLGSVDFVAKS